MGENMSANNELVSSTSSPASPASTSSGAADTVMATTTTTTKQSETQMETKTQDQAQDQAQDQDVVLWVQTLGQARYVDQVVENGKVVKLLNQTTTANQKKAEGGEWWYFTRQRLRLVRVATAEEAIRFLCENKIGAAENLKESAVSSTTLELDSKASTHAKCRCRCVVVNLSCPETKDGVELIRQIRNLPGNVFDGTVFVWDAAALQNNKIAKSCMDAGCTRIATGFQALMELVYLSCPNAMWGLQTEKLRANLEKLNQQLIQRDKTITNRRNAKLTSDKKITAIVLVLSGALNPVHRMHVQSFNEAKREMESDKHGYIVVGGFLSPSSNDYVRGKLGEEAIELKHRAAMCRLATRNSDWIDVCEWGDPSAGSVARRMDRLFAIQLKHLYPNINIQTVELCGADHAVKFKLWTHKAMRVCVSRHGYVEDLRQMMALRPPKCEFIVVEHEHQQSEVSSTKIRELMLAGNFHALSEVGCVEPEVAEYLETQHHSTKEAWQFAENCSDDESYQYCVWNYDESQ